MARSVESMLTPPMEKTLIDKGEKLWFPRENFAEKMERIRRSLERCYEEGILSRESDLGKVVMAIEAYLETEEPVKKIENLSVKEIEKLQIQEEFGGFADCYAPEAIIAAAEIFKRSLH
jgi:hypothetical protein